jgi:WhiB family redox-sensing transcriptional regulator
MARGLCRGQATNTWFPDQGDDIETAKAVCRACPVQPDCLEFAVADASLRGIWGGSGERERMWLRKARG